MFEEPPMAGQMGKHGDEIAEVHIKEKRGVRPACRIRAVDDDDGAHFEKDVGIDHDT